MRLSGALVFLAMLAPLASAVPVISSPAASASVPGGTAFNVEWKDDGTAPAIADLSGYQLLLYSGSGTDPVSLYTASNGVLSSGTSVTVTVPVGIGGSTANAYFFGLMSTATAGGTITTYSSRFTLTGMSSTFSPAVAAANAGVTSSAPPAAKNALAANANAAAGTAAGGLFEISYNLQTGLTKYAPMQPVPPTAITKKDTAPLNPTSAVQFATTFLPNPSQVTTLTASQTFSVASHPNTAATQSSPTPSNDMQRFLNRWKD